MSIREKFTTIFAARGGLAISPEIDALLDAIDGADVGGGQKHQIKHSGNGKWDVVDASGNLVAGGDNMSKKEAQALADKLNKGD